MTKAILFFFLLISIYQINASIPFSTLKSDATELTSIFKEYLNIPIFGRFHKQYRQTLCNYMKKCCPSLRPNYFSILINGTFDSECSKYENSMLKKSNGVQCLQIRNKYYQMKNDPISNRSKPLLSQDQQTLDYQSKIRMTAEKVCSQNELENYVCDSDDLSQYQSCNLKVLQKISKDDGEKYYEEFIQRWKTTESKDNQKLKKYFSIH